MCNLDSNELVSINGGAGQHDIGIKARIDIGVAEVYVKVSKKVTIRKSTVDAIKRGARIGIRLALRHWYVLDNS